MFVIKHDNKVLKFTLFYYHFSGENYAQKT